MFDQDPYKGFKITTLDTVLPGKPTQASMLEIIRNTGKGEEVEFNFKQENTPVYVDSYRKAKTIIQKKETPQPKKEIEKSNQLNLDEVKEARQKRTESNLQLIQKKREEISRIEKESKIQLVTKSIEVFRLTQSKPTDKNLLNFSNNNFSNNNRGRLRLSRLKEAIGETLFSDYLYWYYYITIEYSYLLRTFEILNKFETHKAKEHFTMSEFVFLNGVFKESTISNPKNKLLKNIIGDDVLIELQNVYNHLKENHRANLKLVSTLTYIIKNARPLTDSKEYQFLYRLFVKSSSTKSNLYLEKNYPSLLKKAMEMWEKFR